MSRLCGCCVWFLLLCQLVLDMDPSVWVRHWRLLLEFVLSYSIVDGCLVVLPARMLDGILSHILNWYWNWLQQALCHNQTCIWTELKCYAAALFSNVWSGIFLELDWYTFCSLGMVLYWFVVVENAQSLVLFGALKDSMECHCIFVLGLNACLTTSICTCTIV